MEREYLEDYLKREIENCHATFRALDRNLPRRTQLRTIYGVSGDRPIIYCESGGLRGLLDFPQDALLVIPIFPYRTVRHLEKHLGPRSQIIEECIERHRILPVVQHPAFYEGLDHLEPFFSKATAPCYFVRGQFAYAIILNIEPELVLTGPGIPVLRQIKELMKDCVETHKGWIDAAVANIECWEYRYRAQGSGDDRFYSQLRRSLQYRYASVALCIEQHTADQIIEAFDGVRAAKILLHLHIVFDHVICHGFGSDFVVAPDSPEGKDYQGSKPSLLKTIELNLARGLSVLLPRRKSGWITGLLEEEHFLRGFDFQRVTRENLGDTQVRLAAQFREFTKKVGKVEKSEQLIERTFSLAFFGLGVMDIANDETLKGLAEVAAGTDQSGVPGWLAENVVRAIRRVYEHNLGSYLISGAETGWS